MTRFVSLAVALATSTLLLSATAASAQGGYYVAKPAVAPTKTSLISDGTLWRCTDGVCATGKTTARPAIVCEKVVKNVGALNTFSVNGTAFDEAALAKCNARAK